MSNLALFFSRGISLQKWISTGLLYREIRLYQEHLRKGHFEKICWFTYGNQKEEAEAIKELRKYDFSDSIQVFSKPRWLSFVPNTLYTFILPFLYYRELERCDVFKSNQMDGAWAAYAASLIHKKKFYLRTGYTWSLFEKRPLIHALVLFIEKFLYPRADVYAVSSVEDFEYVKNLYPSGKGLLLRNFIDRQIFKLRTPPARISFVTVARLSAQKNLPSLIMAFKDLPYSLVIIGEGEERESLSQLILREKITNVELRPRVKNDELPEVLSQFSHFILPSFYEGNPKSLLEAMSLGMICLGTNVPGIREIIQDGKNGFLSQGTDPESLKKVIERSLNGSEIIRQNASDYIRNLHDISIIVNQEYALIGNQK